VKEEEQKTLKVTRKLQEAKIRQQPNKTTNIKTNSITVAGNPDGVRVFTYLFTHSLAHLLFTPSGNPVTTNPSTVA
jgi:hypothetical protein